MCTTSITFTFYTVYRRTVEKPRSPSSLEAGAEWQGLLLEMCFSEQSLLGLVSSSSGCPSPASPVTEPMPKILSANTH